MQQALTLLAPVRSPERVPAHLVSLCRSSGEAVLLGIRYGRKTLGAIHCVEHAAELEQRRGLR